ncbi:MAG: hypothetical protein DHS20C18_38430 [Saprospiraceae bacterium]|nr:MAG: hypothetical protein DHS20C18_38430 [Saprospiraceae bacterium]
MQEQKKYCRYLRAKNAFGTLEGGGQPFLDVDPGTTTYWCLCTMSPVGPDDSHAHISTCNNGERPCFKERVKLEE